MEKSYQEILNILTLMGKDELKKSVYKGSTGYLPDEETAVDLLQRQIWRPVQ